MSGAVRAVGNNTTVIGMVVLKPRGEDRVRGGHPWVYRSDIAEVTGAEPGAVVQVRGARQDYVVEANRQLSYEGGATTLVGVTITVKNPSAY